MGKSQRSIVYTSRKLKYILCLFLLFIGKSSVAQTEALVRDLAEENVDWFYDAVTRATNISCNPRFAREKDLRVITAGHFTPSAMIYVSYKKANGKDTIYARTYVDYFHKLSTLCAGTYTKVTFDVISLKIKSSDIKQLENKWTVLAQVKQRFEGMRNNKVVYCDITTKLFTIVIFKNDGEYKSQIDSVKVIKTGSCNDKL